MPLGRLDLLDSRRLWWKPELFVLFKEQSWYSTCIFSFVKTPRYGANIDIRKNSCYYRFRKLFWTLKSEGKKWQGINIGGEVLVYFFLAVFSVFKDFFLLDFRPVLIIRLSKYLTIRFFNIPFGYRFWMAFVSLSNPLVLDLFPIPTKRD